MTFSNGTHVSIQASILPPGQALEPFPLLLFDPPAAPCCRDREEPEDDPLLLFLLEPGLLLLPPLFDELELDCGLFLAGLLLMKP